MRTLGGSAKCPRLVIEEEQVNNHLDNYSLPFGCFVLILFQNIGLSRAGSS